MARVTRGAAPLGQPLPAAAVAADLRGARRLARVLALCHCAAEAWTFCSAPAGSGSQRIAQALLLAAQAALLAFFIFASWGRWRRYRTWAIAALRLVAAAHAPLLYSTQVRSSDVGAAVRAWAAMGASLPARGGYDADGCGKRATC